MIVFGIIDNGNKIQRKIYAERYNKKKRCGFSVSIFIYIFFSSLLVYHRVTHQRPIYETIFLALQACVILFYFFFHVSLFDKFRRNRLTIFMWTETIDKNQNELYLNCNYCLFSPKLHCHFILHEFLLPNHYGIWNDR